MESKEVLFSVKTETNSCIFVESVVVIVDDGTGKENVIVQDTSICLYMPNHHCL